MSLLTQRALRVYSVLNSYNAESGDVLDSLLPFFEPILAKLTGTDFNPQLFAKHVSETYRWNFTADVAEEFIPRFKARGWIKQTSFGKNVSHYTVSYDDPKGLKAASIPNDVESLLPKIVREFRSLISKLSPLFEVSKTDDELSNILVEWLVSIDAYSEDILHSKVMKTNTIGSTIGLSIDLEEGDCLASEDKYLCARFIKVLFQKKSPLLKDLCRIASIGLLTEVIQDFQKPVSRVNKTSVNVYLDGPIALDLLGTSGREAAASIRPLVERLRAIGASVRIFRVSVEEMTNALEAVLKRPITDRTGPTADALRRNEAIEPYVRAVAAGPAEFLTKYGVSIVDRALDQYPGEHEHFSKDQYNELLGRMNWHIEFWPREHDSYLITQIMRMRRSTQTRDLFQTKHIAITKNARLSQLSRVFGMEKGLLSQNSIPAIIHQRQLATAIWLRTGMTDEDADIPKRMLLAACEKVLELKKGVVDQVRYIARSLTTDAAEQIEMLLTQDRSAQVLMDKTLGVSSVVNASNMPALIEDMRKSLVADIEAESKAEIKEIKQISQLEIKAAQQHAELATKQAVEQSKLHRIQTLSSLKVSIIGANRRSRVRSICVHLVVFIGLICIGLLPFLLESSDEYVKYGAISIASMAAILSLSDRLLWSPKPLAEKLKEWAWKDLGKAANDSGLGSAVADFGVVYNNGKFSLPAELSENPLQTNALI